MICHVTRGTAHVHALYVYIQTKCSCAADALAWFLEKRRVLSAWLHAIPFAFTLHSANASHTGTLNPLRQVGDDGCNVALLTSLPQCCNNRAGSLHIHFIICFFAAYHTPFAPALCSRHSQRQMVWSGGGLQRDGHRPHGPQPRRLVQFLPSEVLAQNQPHAGRPAGKLHLLQSS